MRVFSKVIVVLAVIAAAAFYGLGLAGIEPFTGFNLSWAIVIVLWAIGIALLLFAFALKSKEVQLKKVYVWLAVGFILAGILLIINAVIDNGSRYYIPIIVIVLGLGALISVLVGAHKKWDQGDNQKKGYLNYHERKALAEEKSQQNEDKNGK